MHVCACICMYVHVCICMCMYVHVCICMCVYVHVRASMCMYVQICVHIYVPVLARFYPLHEIDLHKKVIDMMLNTYFNKHAKLKYFLKMQL